MIDKINCLFCGTENCSRTLGHFVNIDCPRCGQYKYIGENTHNILSKLFNYQKTLPPDQLSIFQTYCSYTLHHDRKDENNIVSIDENKIDDLINNKRSFDMTEQIDNFIYWICSSNYDCGSDLPVLLESNAEDYLKTYENIFSWFGCKSLDNFLHLIGLLKKDDFIFTNDMPYESFYAPTIKAYQYFKTLKEGKSSKKAFLALKFDGDLNKKHKQKLKDAVKSTDFELKTVDEEPKAGSINDKIRLEIRNSAFVIADLTDGNQGAYWEAGFAEGLGKKVIYLCEKNIMEDKYHNNHPHFDVRPFLCIKWDDNDIDEAMESLKATIRYTFPNAKQEDDEV